MTKLGGASGKPARVITLGLYMAIAALPAASNLLLTFLLIRGLGIEGFAAWSIVEPLLLIFAVVATFGTHFAVMFFSARGELDPHRVLGASLVAAIPPATVLAVVVGLVVHHTTAQLSAFSLILPLVADAASLQVTAAMRGRRLLGIWAAFEFVRSLGLAIVGFAALRWAPAWVDSLDHFLLLRGTLTATAVAAAAVALKARPNFDRALIERLVRYGFPVSGSSLLGLLINSADRFLLAALHMPAGVIATFATHQRLTGVLGVFTVSPLQLWFPVEAVRRGEEEAHFFQGVQAAVLAALVGLSAATFVAGPLLWPHLFPQVKFEPVLFAVLTVAIVPRALAILFNVGGLREKKTHLNTASVAATGVSVVVLGVPLVLAAGALGAAWARLGAQAIQVIGTGFISQRIAPIRYNYVALLPFGAALALSIFIPSAQGLRSALSTIALVGTLGLIVGGIAANWTSLRALIREERAS